MASKNTHIKVIKDSELHKLIIYTHRLLVSVSKASSALALMTLSPVGLVNFSSGQIRRCYTCQRSACSLMAVCSFPKFTTHVHIICNPKRC